MSGLSLYTLSADFAAAFDAAIDPETGEVRSDELATRLDSITADVKDKIDAVAAFRRAREAEAAALQAEEERLAARRRTLTNQAESLKQYVGKCLKVAGLPSVKGKLFTARWQKNGGVQPVKITNPQALPPHLTVIEVKPDTVKIRAALQAGEEVPGAELEPVGEHVRIS